ncbi:MAG: hypothetical protein ABL893_18090 [Hyphomicrobium sp.]
MAFENTRELADELLGDVQLGKLILSVSYVDYLLGELIKSRLVKHSESDKLFSPNDHQRVSFIPKARLAFSLGLISLGDLICIKELAAFRNGVAHGRVADLLAKEHEVFRKRVGKNKNEDLSSSDIRKSFDDRLAMRQIEALVLTHKYSARLLEIGSNEGPKEWVDNYSVSNK